MTSARKTDGPPPRPLCILLQHVGKLLDDRMREALRPLAIHPSQAHVLRVLAVCEGVQQHELARRMMITPPTMSGILDRLAKAGLIRREPDPADERAVRVFLLPAGKRMRKKVEQVVNEVESQLIAGLSDDRIQEAHRLLRILRNNLGGHPPGPEWEPDASLDSPRTVRRRKRHAD
ncbi:MAG: MarR family transcriptional regulator [Planctomycetota bacterium]|nr:MAG: MarR family transcriptional regulator [Planctomycetota bacterium]